MIPTNGLYTGASRQTGEHADFSPHFSAFSSDFCCLFAFFFPFLFLSSFPNGNLNVLFLPNCLLLLLLFLLGSLQLCLVSDFKPHQPPLILQALRSEAPSFLTRSKNRDASITP